jgi:hypothetical protein
VSIGLGVSVVDGLTTGAASAGVALDFLLDFGVLAVCVVSRVVSALALDFCFDFGVLIDVASGAGSGALKDASGVGSAFALGFLVDFGVLAATTCGEISA